MTDSAAPSEPIPFRVLLDEAMKLTRRHIGAIYLPLAVPIALLAALFAVAQLQYAAQVVEAGSPRAMFTGVGCFAILGSLLGWLALRGLASGVAAAAAVDAAAGRPVATGANWHFILQPAALSTLVFAMLAIAAGFCLLIFPGVYIGLRLSLLVPVMAAEGLRGGAAMKRSWSLVRYNPHKRFLDNTATKVFLLYLVAGLIGWAVGFIVQLPFTAMQGFRLMRAVSSGRDAALAMRPNYAIQVPSVIASSLVSSAIMIYTAFGIVLLYLDVVRRKEGSDLATAIDARFGGAGPGPASPPAPGPGTSPA